jgi:SRSO17 transposase
VAPLGGDGVLIADETGDAKSSTDHVGAAHQYSGSPGGVGLCQVSVRLACATGRGHTVIDRTPHPGRNWAGDEERREHTGGPEELVFATKTAHSPARPAKADGAVVRASFCSGDEVQGARALQTTCRPLGLGHAVTVRTDRQVTLPTGRKLVCAKAKALVPARAWQRMRTGSGGARDYGWATLDVPAGDAPDGQADGGVSVLPARRHRYACAVSHHRCWSTTPVSLAGPVGVACLRWEIEEDSEAAKRAIGLDRGQVTS